MMNENIKNYIDEYYNIEVKDGIVRLCAKRKSWMGNVLLGGEIFLTEKAKIDNIKVADESIKELIDNGMVVETNYRDLVFAYNNKIKTEDDYKYFKTGMDKISGEYIAELSSSIGFKKYEPVGNEINELNKLKLIKDYEDEHFSVYEGFEDEEYIAIITECDEGGVSYFKYIFSSMPSIDDIKLAEKIKYKKDSFRFHRAKNSKFNDDLEKIHWTIESPLR